ARKHFISLIMLTITILWHLLTKEQGADFKIYSFAMPAKYFFLTSSIVLMVSYQIFLFYIYEAYASITTLPHIFPDGSIIHDYPDPWFIAGVSRIFTPRHVESHQVFWGYLSSVLIWITFPIISIILVCQSLLIKYTLAFMASILCLTSSVGMSTFYFINTRILFTRYSSSNSQIPKLKKYPDWGWFVIFCFIFCLSIYAAENLDWKWK
ncbi:MAG: hypothetical protein PVG03_12365, partial [Desulfarculaceae bacterium]